MKLTPYARNYVQRFMSADAGGGAGGGDTPPAPTGGDTPPAPSGDTPPAPGEGGSKAGELGDFEPPDFSGIDDGDKPPGEKPPEPKPGEKPPEPPKGKPGEKPPDKPPEGEPPIAKLREELTRLKAENADLSEKAKAPARVTELETELATLKSERETLQKETEEMRTRLNMLDPAANEEITKLVSAFDADYNRAIEFVPALDANYKNFVAEFEALPREDRTKYQAALDAFEEKVSQAVGEKRVPAALELIRKGAEFRVSHGKLQKELRDNAGKAVFEGRKKQWDASAKLTNEHLGEAFKVPDDFATLHPFHPVNFVTNARGALDDPGKTADKEFEGKVDRYIGFAANGISPATLAEIEGLAPKERAERIATAETHRVNAAKWVRTMAKRAAYYERYLGAMLKDYAAMREAAEKKGVGTPPDPTKPGGNPGGNQTLEDIAKRETASAAESLAGI